MTQPVPSRWIRSDWYCLAAVVALAVALWLPRLRGPLDLRFDAGVYYILGQLPGPGTRISAAE